MRPGDVLKLRRDLWDECVSIADWPPEDHDDVGQSIHATYASAAPALLTSQAYYVSEDMTQLVRAAAPGLPAESLVDGDQPADAGLIVYDHPSGIAQSRDEYRLTVVGAVWGYTRRHAIWEEGDGARIMGPPHSQPADDWDRAPDYYADALTIIPVGIEGDGSRGPRLLGRVTWWSMDDEPIEDPNSIVDYFDFRELVQLVRATWILMSQSLTVTGPGLVDRAERRRSERADLPSDVLVVMLRRITQSQHESASETQGRDYSHRWLVAGHWRNQWLPSRGTHRLQWIAPYVKGPDDKPLVVKERVTAWVR